MAQKSEEAAATNNMRALYKIVNPLANNKYKNDRTIEDKDGNLLSPLDEHLKIQQEYYEELMKKNEKGHISNIKYGLNNIHIRVTTLNMKVCPSTQEEFRESINQMRNGLQKDIWFYRSAIITANIGAFWHFV